MSTTEKIKVIDSIKSFVSKVDKLYKDYMEKRFPNNKLEEFSMKVSHKYTKVIRGNSVFCFVDNSNGDVLFAKTWSQPDKKNVRGNVFSEQNGMEAVTQTLRGNTIHPHIKYLRA